jgi:hypothetical protein
MSFMTDSDILKLYLEADYEISRLLDQNSGDFMFCGGRKCRKCKIVNQCNDFNSTTKPTMSENELDIFTKEHPEYLI